MEELVQMLIDQGAIDASAESPGDQRRTAAGVSGAAHAHRRAPSQARRPAGGGAAYPAAGQRHRHGVLGPALVALDAQAEATLPALVQRELALPQHDSALAGLREYAFKHSILHQVTYGTVLKRHRKLLHAKLAGWLAAQSRGENARAGDFLGLTAQHYAEAGDEAHAVEFHVRAAEHAADRLAHGAVMAHAQQALALLDRGKDNPTLRWRLLRAREQTLDVQGERERQAVDLDAMDLVAMTLNDGIRRAEAAYRRAWRSAIMRDADSERSALRAITLTDEALASRAHSAVSPAAANALHELRLLSLSLLGFAWIGQERLNEAQSLLQESLKEARERRLLKPQAHCIRSLAMLAWFRDDRVRILELLQEALNLSRATGDRRFEAIELCNVGIGWLALGDLDAARRDLEEGLRLLRQNDDRALEGAFLCGLSTLSLWQGDGARALRLARRGLDIAVSVQGPEAGAWLCLGDAEAALGQQASAAQAYAKAHQAAQESGSGMRFDAGAGLARLALAQGDTDGALQAVRALLSLSEGTATDRVAPDFNFVAAAAAGRHFYGADWPRQVELSVYRVLATALDPGASAWLQRAHRTMMAQADAIANATLRAMFLANIPHHREITALWGCTDSPLASRATAAWTQTGCRLRVDLRRRADDSDRPKPVCPEQRLSGLPDVGRGGWPRDESYPITLSV